MCEVASKKDYGYSIPGLEARTMRPERKHQRQAGWCQKETHNLSRSGRHVSIQRRAERSCEQKARLHSGSGQRAVCTSDTPCHTWFSDLTWCCSFWEPQGHRRCNAQQVAFHTGTQFRTHYLINGDFLRSLKSIILRFSVRIFLPAARREGSATC